MDQTPARTPRLMRRMNSGAILQYALGADEFTATTAMDAIGLTRATVLGVCGDLVDAGWLEIAEDTRTAGLSHRGRPARRYRLRSDAGVVIGLDAGEDRFAVAVADLRGRILARRERRLERATGEDERLELARELIAHVLHAAGSNTEDVLVTVVGVPAPIDAGGRSPKGSGRYWPRMNPGYVDHLDGAVVVENDANLAAFAEVGGHPSGNVATLLTDERFGAGLVVDGRLLRGRRGGAGELRFLDLLVQADAAAGFKATDGIGRVTRTRARAGVAEAQDAPVLGAMDPELIEAADVFAAARDGDAFARSIVDEVAQRLAHVAMVLESVLDLESVIVSGPIAGIVEPVLIRARAILEQKSYAPVPQLRASARGPDVVLRGAVDDALAQVRENPMAFAPRVAVE